MDNQIDKILEFVTNEEDKYYDFAFKCMNKNNFTGNMINSAQASAFQKVRYFIEILLEEEK